MKMRKYSQIVIYIFAASVYLLTMVITVHARQSAAFSTTAKVGSDPCEIPVPPIKTPMGKLPGVDKLPVRAEMPDVLTMNDGTKVTTLEQWKERRKEIRHTLEYYATGQVPPAPGNVKGTEVLSETIADGKIKYRLVHLTFGPEEKLSLDIGIFTPSEGGPFPTIILQGGTPPGAVPLPRLPQGPNQGRGKNVLIMVGPVPGKDDIKSQDSPVPISTAEKMVDRFECVLKRNYALVIFNQNDCAEDTTLRNLDGSWAFRNTRFFPAYPDYDWGILAAWAWGASRITDYLETDQAIDKDILIITGASRCGKSSMIAAAFDERLMGAPVVTGGGGTGAYRFTGPRGSETMDLMETKYPNWFSPNLHQFRGHKDKLPFDQHFFFALCAPRPFICLEGMTDRISLPEAVRQSILGARPAYELYGKADRLGANFANHGHTLNDEDWIAMMDFADKHLRNKPVNRTFDRFPTEEELDKAMGK